MVRKLSEQTIVITGASSGIGRETALALAHRGASVVLAARGARALAQVADDVERAGGRALPVVVDVAEWDQVQRLVAAAVAWSGRIDTWINDAAVMSYGTLEQMAVEEIERVLRVNVMGTVHGMKAVLPQMRRQGGGTIINVASILAERALPLQAVYGASKHAVRGFTDAVRVEQGIAGTNVRLCLIEVGSTNTPLYDHALSRLGVKARAVNPLHAPSVPAAAIVECVERPRDRVVVGAGGKLLTLLQKLSPALVDAWLIQGDRGVRMQQTADPVDGPDNLFSTVDGPARSEGRFEVRARGFSLYTWLRLAVTRPFASLAQRWAEWRHGPGQGQKPA